MDINELFSQQAIVKAKYNGCDVHHHLRQPTLKENLEYRRQMARVKVKNGEIHQTEVSMLANANLYDKICQKVEVINGEGPQLVENHVEKIPEDLKFVVIQAFQSRIQIQEDDDLGN